VGVAELGLGSGSQKQLPEEVSWKLAKKVRSKAQRSPPGRGSDLLQFAGGLQRQWWQGRRLF